MQESMEHQLLFPLWGGAIFGGPFFNAGIYVDGSSVGAGSLRAYTKAELLTEIRALGQGEARGRTGSLLEILASATGQGEGRALEDGYFIITATPQGWARGYGTNFGYLEISSSALGRGQSRMFDQSIFITEIRATGKAAGRGSLRFLFAKLAPVTAVKKQKALLSGSMARPKLSGEVASVEIKAVITNKE